MYTCGHCERACKGADVDFGNGPTEFWGQSSNDVCIQFVSSCCEHEMFYDAALTEPVETSH
ncbi:MAG: hypothetical protein ACPHQD_04720 [Vibrio toranzoniae]|uniref:hypothetical protein n=1 Tax=Vibrio toranzoniae TaxID=1194427 RepID=UPI003C4E4F3A